MSLKNYGREELEGKSMIELGQLVLQDEKQAMHFRDIFNEIAEIKELTETEKEERIVQFYTDLNLEGRFITIGSNMWGLKRWYPVDKIDEDVATAPKQKKKKAKVKKKKTEEVQPKEDESLDVVDPDMEEVAGGFPDDEAADAEFDDEALGEGADDDESKDEDGAEK